MYSRMYKLFFVHLDNNGSIVVTDLLQYMCIFLWQLNELYTYI